MNNIDIIGDEIVKQAARCRLLSFSRYMMPDMDVQPYMRAYYHALDMFAHGKIKKLIVSVPPQHGKALLVDTPVLTTEGWKRHGDLKRGDYVFGDDGKPKMVLNNFGSYVWHTQRIHFADGMSIVAAREHEWKVFVDYDDHKGRQEKILETQHIFSRRHRRSPFIRADAVVSMPDKYLPIDPYLLGLWLGDGLSEQGVIVSGSQDADMYHSIGEVRLVRDRYYRILVKGLTRLLRENGLIKNKHIPTEYMTASERQRWELLRGLMDTDGCCDRKGRCEFTQKSGQLGEDVYVLMRSLGLKATRHYYDAKLNGNSVGVKIRLIFTPDRNMTVFKLKRKQDRITNKIQTDRDDKRKFFITSIEDADNALVNCIEVEGGMYLAGKHLIPTHNSQGSSRFLPAFLLGLDPDKKIAIGSYSTTFAEDFNRDVQRIIDTDEYREIFPATTLSKSNVVTQSGNYLRNSTVFEIVGHRGYLRVVGRGGALTGKTIDVSILDDVYKDYAEANSPVVREAAWKWYTTVVKTRLHNNSQELIVFTRWHDDDLIGRLEKSGEKIIEFKRWDDVSNIPTGAWLRINFEAIKESDPTEIDSRPQGVALWPNRHGIELLNEKKRLDPVQFQCLYQGNPSSAEGRLYQPFKTWANRDEWGRLVRSGCYVDVADEGDDYLAAICYDIVVSPNTTYNEKTRRQEPILFALVTDIILTDENTDVTTVSVPQSANMTGAQRIWVESNNGGAQFEKVIKKKTRAITKLFTQRNNKEARIVSNAPLINQHIIMPIGWETRYPKAYEDITRFLRNFRANAHDDMADALTGVYEKEIADGNTHPYDYAKSISVRR